ncbi:MULTISPECIES: hypothetical protein [unclassified Methanoregula]|uniref:hypothetical protein n=1 Tax=unclassified Methanoregula TaxID=2649730 RepID=UPI0009CB1A6C|nr:MULTISPECIES: hypothetical protein [unclassified Methanoregula]OPX65170.1 MAG: hypothetical protein A4E33_00201 [Methanoregula sp. PtaB.Bin085]OPY32082.1 MAG: hypothetical protein A4E34_02454 [Methanoregula sp. PtaU1.Bin006]
MLAESCIPTTTKIMALGHSLREAERIAAVIVIECIVLYMMMGFRIAGSEPEYPTFSRDPSRTMKDSPAGHCGNVPAVAPCRDHKILQCQRISA